MRMNSIRALTVILALLALTSAWVASPEAVAQAQGTCGTAPTPRLVIGQMARVTVAEGTGNNLRQSPSSSATVLGVMAEGEVFTVLNGPQCAEGFYWWQVRRWDGQAGWTAEGTANEYWLEPWPVPGARLAAGQRPTALLNTLIAFSATDNPNIDTPLALYTVAVGGAPLVKLPNLPADGPGAVWSPTGTRLAYSNGTDIFITDGLQVTNLTLSTGVFNYSPTWSPDGLRIAFVSERDGNAEIYSVSLDGTNLRNLTNNPAADKQPAWSPDGTRIAFISERDGSAELYVMSAADGANPQRLTTTPTLFEAGPVWSPNSQWLAYEASDTAGTNIMVIAALPPASPLTLTQGGLNHDPAWSPDSKRIAYAGRPAVSSSSTDLFSVRADGTDRIEYTVSGLGIHGLSWSPDGQWIVFSSTLSGTGYDLFLIHASGAGLANLTTSPSLNEVAPVWQPGLTPASLAGLPTPAPTLPGAVVNPAAQDLLLIYNAATPVFTLQNTSGKALNLVPLSFSGAGLAVPSSIWAEFTASPLDNFQNLGCLQLWPFGLPDQPAPPECGTARQGWVVNSGYTFWTQGSFTVLYNGVPVATCDAAAGRCVVDLP